MIVVEKYRGKKVGVFGLGITGVSAVRSLLASGATVYAFDDRDNLVAGIEESFEQANTQSYASWPWDELDALILSPGVPHCDPGAHRIIGFAKKHNCLIITDIELLFLAHPEATYIGITGTNGKSTTTSLIHHICQAAGIDCYVGGNIGTPVLDLEPPKHDKTVYIIEMSSYQLELLDQFVCNIAVFLNLTPDHLDRHHTMKAYHLAKERIFKGQQQGSDHAFIGYDDDYTRKSYEHISHAVAFSSQVIPAEGIAVIDGEIIDHRLGDQVRIPIGDIPHLKGAHNAQNIAAAYGVAKVLGINNNVIIDALRSFRGLSHRMQYIGKSGNVSYYNDSKATNADATAKALTISEHIYWIVGGLAKDGGISSLEPYFNNITQAYLIGDAQEEFAHQLKGKVPFSKCGTLDVAFRAANLAAHQDGHNGAVVLLSPACASFDQFENFGARGDSFVNLVREEL